MRSARAAVRVAEAHHQETFWAFWPLLTLSASYTRLSWVPTIALPDFSRAVRAAVENHDYTCIDQPSTAGCAGAIELTSSLLDRWDLRASLVIPLTDMAFRFPQLHDASRLTVEARNADLEAATLTARLRGREAYYEYSRAIARNAVALAAIDLATRRRDDTARLADAGRLARVDVARADATVADARRNAAVAQMRFDIAVAELRRRLGIDETGALPEPIDVAEEIPPVPERFDDLLRTAMRSAPELRSLDRQASAVSATASGTRATQFPSLAAVGDFDYSNPNPRIFPLVNIWVPSYDVGVQLSWSPTNALSAGATISRLEAERAHIEAVREETREELETNLRNAWIEARESLAQVDLAHESVVAAEANQRAMRDRFRAGETTLTDLTASDNELNRARLVEIDVRIDALLARARMQRLLGQP